jgi:hypothetical protein
MLLSRPTPATPWHVLGPSCSTSSPPHLQGPNQIVGVMIPLTTIPTVQHLLLLSFQQIVVRNDEQIAHRQLGLACRSHGPVCAVRCPVTKASAVDHFHCSASTLAHGLHHFLLQRGPVWPSTIPLLLNVRDVLVCDYDVACRNSSPFD